MPNRLLTNITTTKPTIAKLTTTATTTSIGMFCQCRVQSMCAFAYVCLFCMKESLHGCCS